MGPRRQRRGRRRCRRRVDGEPSAWSFEPMDGQSRERVELHLEEFEAVRLVDHMGLKQVDAAARMGVSQKTLSNDLNAARGKIADAIVNGKRIHIMDDGEAQP